MIECQTVEKSLVCLTQDLSDLILSMRLVSLKDILRLLNHSPRKQITNHLPILAWRWFADEELVVQVCGDFRV